MILAQYMNAKLAATRLSRFLESSEVASSDVIAEVTEAANMIEVNGDAEFYWMKPEDETRLNGIKLEEAKKKLTKLEKAAEKKAKKVGARNRVANIFPPVA